MFPRIPVYGFMDCNESPNEFPSFKACTFAGIGLDHFFSELSVIGESDLAKCLDIESEGVVDVSVERGDVEPIGEEGEFGYRIRIRFVDGRSILVVAGEHSGHGWWRWGDA